MFVQASDSSGGKTSDLVCSLHIPDGADVCYCDQHGDQASWYQILLEKNSHGLIQASTLSLKFRSSSWWNWSPTLSALCCNPEVWFSTVKWLLRGTLSFPALSHLSIFWLWEVICVFFVFYNNSCDHFTWYTKGTDFTRVIPRNILDVASQPRRSLKTSLQDTPPRWHDRSCNPVH